MTREETVTRQAEQDALTAAHDALSPLRRHADQSIGEYVKQILLAVQAVRRVQATAQALLNADNDEYVSLDPIHIVATALFVGDDLEDETHPYCVGAIPFVGFARACLILEAAANYHGIVADLDADLLSEGYVDEALAAVAKAESDAIKVEDRDHDA